MSIIVKLIVVVFLFTACTQTNYSVQKYNPTKNGFVENKTKQNITPMIVDSIETEEKVEKKESTKIAILFPSLTIGKYALEATNSINTYLINKENSFRLGVYDLVVQNQQNITKMLQKITSDKITKVIAMITKENLKYLVDIKGIENIQFYFPLIHKDDIQNIEIYDSLDVTFGAISYKAQFKKLIAFRSRNSLVEFYDNSGIGKTLHEYVQDEKVIYTKKIDDNNGRYKSFLGNNRRLNNSLVLLNTPIIKSSILLSTITAQELSINTIASTQLNYTPLLFSLTQKHDRRKLVVANSIGNIPIELEEYNRLIGNNLQYSWVNYSTIVGVEYLLNGNIDLFNDLTIINNQVIFPVNLYRVGNNSFKRIR